jgi:hypothetical protein
MPRVNRAVRLDLGDSAEERHSVRRAVRALHGRGVGLIGVRTVEGTQYGIAGAVSRRTRCRPRRGHPPGWFRRVNRQSLEQAAVMHFPCLVHGMRRRTRPIRSDAEHDACACGAPNGQPRSRSSVPDRRVEPSPLSSFSEWSVANWVPSGAILKKAPLFEAPPTWVAPNRVPSGAWASPPTGLLPSEDARCEE